MIHTTYSRNDAIILELLSSTDKVIPFASLCTRFNVSDRTMRNVMNEVKDELEDNELSLMKRDGMNYYVAQDSEQLMKRSRHLIEAIEAKYKNNNYDTPNGRYLYLMKRLLLANDYIKLDDLAEAMYVSKSTVSNDLKRVKKRLEEYTLSIKGMPHYGIIVDGDEQHRRACILDNGLIDHTVFAPNGSLEIWSSMLDDHRYKEIETLVSDVVFRGEFQVFRSFLNNLIMHVYVSIKRIEAQCIVTCIELKEQGTFDQEYRLAKAIADETEQKLGVVMPESEIVYLQHHLIGKQREEDGVDTIPEVKDLVKRMVAAADVIYNYNFTQDDILQHDLYLHIKSVKNRLEDGAQMRNPLRDEIKSRYPLAFEISLASIRHENNWLEILSEDEVAYIAIHIAASIERQKINTESAKKRVLVICASGIGTARLMEVKLKRRFDERIDLVVKESKMGVTQSLINAFDLTLTTVPISEIDHKKTMLIHAIPTRTELDAIEAFLFPVEHLGYRLEQVFREPFFELGSYTDKQQLLNAMICKLKDEGIVADDFVDSVLEREQYSSTCVGNFIALPHAILPSAKVSTIYTMILDQPLEWNETERVQIVFLLAIEFSKSKYFSEVYDLIVDLVENEAYVNELLNVTNYDDFISKMIEIQVRGREHG